MYILCIIKDNNKDFERWCIILNQTVLVLDFGGQFNQLIARRVRESNVYCEVYPYNISISDIKKKNPIGIILTGGPNSVYEEGAPKLDKEIFNMGIPILGICYGSQLMADILGGEVSSSITREYGKTLTNYDNTSDIFSGIDIESYSWMSHTDYILKMPKGFKKTAYTSSCPVAAMEDKSKKLYAIQFHPEVSHTEFGKEMIQNFLINICKAKKDWTMENYAKKSIISIKEKVGSGKVLLALSGGVDSSVAAALLSKAVGDNLICIFVDHGFMRKDEAEEVRVAFSDMNLNLIIVDAKKRFMDKLEGIIDPEEKRKIIGEEFIRVFEDEAKKIGTVEYLVQGTIYPDVIESGFGNSAVIKSHHNVGGIPDCVEFKEIIEPLRLLFKDEVRNLGLEIGLPEYLVFRQPFPGPGLAIRIIGEITEKKLDILRESDYIFREEIKKAGLHKDINQYFTVLTSVKSVGVMGDFRTYDYTLALRAVTTTDFMTADFAKIPYEYLEKISVRIVNEVKHINRIVYDITTKPPATIEWE